MITAPDGYALCATKRPMREDGSMRVHLRLGVALRALCGVGGMWRYNPVEQDRHCRHCWGLAMRAAK